MSCGRDEAVCGSRRRRCGREGMDRSGVAGLGFGRPRGCCRCQLGRPGWPDGQLGRGLVGGPFFCIFFSVFILFYFSVFYYSF